MYFFVPQLYGSFNTLRRTIAVTQAMIPGSFYNIDASNNQFVYTFLSTTNTIEIPYGFYSVYSIISLLTKTIPAGTIAVSYDITSMKCKVSAPTPFSIQCNNFTLLLGSGQTTETVESISNNTSYEYTFPCVVDVNKVKSVHFSSAALVNTNIDLLDSQSYLCSVPIVNLPPGINQWFANERLELEIEDSKATAWIDISLQDQNNNDMDFNGIDWQIELCITEYIEKRPLEIEAEYLRAITNPKAAHITDL